MPSVITIEGSRACRFHLTRVFHGERETKGCFPTKRDALDFADLLNPLPCSGKQCWTPIVARPPGVPRSLRGIRQRRRLRRRVLLGQPDWRKTGRLGSSAGEHRESAGSYRAMFVEGMVDTKRLLTERHCPLALHALIGAAQYLQGFKAHGQAFRQGAKKRQTEAGAMERDLYQAVDRYETMCLPIKRW